MALNDQTVTGLQELGGCYIDYGAGQEGIMNQACWSWALAGSIDGVMVNPNDLVQAVIENNRGFIGQQNEAVREFLGTLFTNVIDDATYDTHEELHRGLLETLVRCQGMTIAEAGTTNFEICMEYESHELDWTHWGINAYGHALETTPGELIDLHRSAFEDIWHEPDNNCWVVKVSVENLLPAHETIINNIIAELAPLEDLCNHQCA